MALSRLRPVCQRTNCDIGPYGTAARKICACLVRISDGKTSAEEQYNIHVVRGGIRNCDNDILTFVMFDVQRSARGCCLDAVGEDVSDDVRLGGGGEIPR